MEPRFDAEKDVLREAVVMAGGLGTRLGSLTAEKPKPMLDVAGKPFLKYLLDYMRFNGIEHVVLAVSYRHEAIENYFGKTYKSISISYFISDPPMGTGGDLVGALEFTDSRNVAVLNGDTLFDVPLDRMFAFHLCHEAAVTLALKPMTNVDRYGVVQTDYFSSRIIEFKEKAYFDYGLINGGIYVIDKSVTRSLKNEPFSFEKDFLEKCYELYPIYGFVSDTFFIDIGTEEDYRKAQVLVPEVAERWE